MFKLNYFALLAVSLPIFAASAASPSKLLVTDSSKAVENQYIVVFNSAAKAMSKNAFKAQLAANTDSLVNKYNVTIKLRFDDVLNGVVVTADKQQLEQLLKDDNVRYVEQDQYFTLDPVMSTTAVQNNATWGLDRIDQHDLPLDNTYNYQYDGNNVTAYVIDTGIRNSHQEFGGRASSGYDFVDNDNDSSDCNGHGTHVAGTIGGSTWGVAKNVNLVGVRVLNCSGSGTYSGVISGINWVKNNAALPAVANMSLGGGASQAVDDAVNNLVSSGITTVVAAGNSNADACSFSPARAVKAITVGSTTNTDARSSFSNYGSCLDVFAPGSSITSAWYNSDNATNTISGTSMAAPHVAGVAALYLNENNSLTPAQIDSLISSRSTKNKVTNPNAGSPNELLYSLNDDNDSPQVEYRAHVAYMGWLPWVDDGATAGTTGQSRRMEASQMKLTHSTMQICYSAHVAGIGWMNPVCNGAVSGTTGQSRQMEATKVWLNNAPAGCNIEYRAHVAGNGWLGWVQNGAQAGTTGQSRQMEALQAKLTGNCN
ncbi:S8 family serine peptidase [Shewanella sp.]|uniref:S8 family serine peptidase n=1 Tax=Shewanella sp. TaxID=50422 RepID=UPI00405401A6